jgi:hypothetical protein
MSRPGVNPINLFGLDLLNLFGKLDHFFTQDSEMVKLINSILTLNILMSSSPDMVGIYRAKNQL